MHPVNNIVYTTVIIMYRLLSNHIKLNVHNSLFSPTPIFQAQELLKLQESAAVEADQITGSGSTLGDRAAFQS